MTENELPLKFHDGALDPGSFLEVPHVAATANALGSRFEGDARAKVTFEATVAGQLQPHLEAVMQSFRIAPESAPGQPYVHGRDLRIDAITRGARDDLRDRIQARLWFSDARVPDIRVYNRYLPKTSLQLTGGEGTLSGDLHFDREGAVGKGPNSGSSDVRCSSRSLVCRCRETSRSTRSSGAQT